MSILSVLLNLSLSISLHAQAAPLVVGDSCTGLIGTCDYYACVERERLSCGAKGYPMGYGVNYCEKLSALEFSPAHTSLGAATFPADGNEWRDRVRTCLQVEMDDQFARKGDMSCSELKAFAFNSHPKCYTEESPSFCELTVESVLKVGLTIAPKDLLTKESLTQVTTTAGICSDQLSKRLETESNLLVRLNLMKYRSIWNAIAIDPAKVSEHLKGLRSSSDPSDSL